MVAGALVLLGWAANVAVLKSIVPGLATMKVNTALCFTLAGAALWLRRVPPTTAGQRRLAHLCVLAVLALAGMTLIEYLFGWNLRLDEVFVRDVVTDPRFLPPGRMSAATAVGFLLLSGALMALDAASARAASLSQALSVVVLVVGLIGLEGYLYGSQALSSFFLFSSIAVHTAVLFIVMGLGTLWARPLAGPVAVLTDTHMGGRFIRPSLLPLAMLLIALGWLTVQGERAGFYNAAVGVALFGTASLLIVIVVAWGLAARLNELHEALEAQHDRLNASTRELQDLRTALNEHAIVAFTDPQGRIISINAQFSAISGYASAELLGGDHRRLSSGHHSQTFFADLWETIGGGRVWHGEIKNKAKNGISYWLAITIVPFLDALGRITQFIEVGTDITLRKELEDALRAGEERFRALVESLPQLIWTCRGDGVCDYLSPQWVAYTGLPAQPQPGDAWLERLHPDDRDRATQAWQTVTRSGEAYEIEFRIRRHDGHYRWFKASATPLRDATGVITKWFGSNTDIQDLRDAETALRQVNRDLEARVQVRTAELATATEAAQSAATQLSAAHERIRLATAAASIGIWDWNVHDNVLAWDPTMFRLYGIEEDQSVGGYETWRRALHPDDLARADAELAAALRGEREFDTAFRVVQHPSGATRYLRGAAVVHRDDTGRPVRMVGINWDVTEQRQAEQALRSSERLLREFVVHAPAAIAMLDRDVRYLLTSERWLEDYHLTGQDIVGRNHYEVFPDLPERWKAIHQRALAGAIERCDEDVFRRADGSTEWLQWEVRPWLTASGDIGGLLFFTQVITARKQLELDLTKQKRALERSNAELEQFAYVASHDLQEPLRAVAGCSQILKRRYGGQLDAGADELIQHIVDGAERMHDLIHDLLAFSRLDRQRLDLAPTDSAAALRRALTNLQTAIGEGEAIVTVDALPTLPADGAQLTQLFQNLIGNALKYRRAEPPRIHVSAIRTDHLWEFSVHDNGIGIEPQYFERIFSLFQRLHTRAEYPGTGIGLAICKKIVERHSGRMWVESTPGVGSVFHFSIPASAPRPS